MSEMVMFQKKVESDGTVTYAGYGHAIAGFSFDNYPVSGVTDYLNQKNGTSGGYELFLPVSLTTNSILMIPSNPNYAFSLALGFPIGVDMTVKVSPSLFATGSVGWSEQQPLNWQLILQNRLLDGNPIGFSIGAMIVRHHVGYSGVDSEPYEGACSVCGISPGNYIPSTAIGVRSVLILRHYPNYETTDRVFLYTNAAYMYDTTMKLWYPKVGFSLGFY